MRTFANIPAFVAHLGGLAAEVNAHGERALERAAVILENDAKDSLGEYQAGAGPFAAWPELTASTQAERVAKGYSADEPLLRSGDLRDAITHEVEGRVAMIGVPDSSEASSEGSTPLADVAEFMEHGTSRAPPRPFIGPAAFRKGEVAATAAGEELAVHVFGLNRIGVF